MGATMNESFLLLPSTLILDTLVNLNTLQVQFDGQGHMLWTYDRTYLRKVIGKLMVTWLLVPVWMLEIESDDGKSILPQSFGKGKLNMKP